MAENLLALHVRPLDIATPLLQASAIQKQRIDTQNAEFQGRQAAMGAEFRGLVPFADRPEFPQRWAEAMDRLTAQGINIPPHLRNTPSPLLLQQGLAQTSTPEQYLRMRELEEQRAISAEHGRITGGDGVAPRLPSGWVATAGTQPGPARRGAVPYSPGQPSADPNLTIPRSQVERVNSVATMPGAGTGLPVEQTGPIPGVPLPGTGAAPIAGAPQDSRVQRLLTLLSRPGISPTQVTAIQATLQQIQPDLQIISSQDGTVLAVNKRTGQVSTIHQGGRPQWTRIGSSAETGEDEFGIVDVANQTVRAFRNGQLQAPQPLSTIGTPPPATGAATPTPAATPVPNPAQTPVPPIPPAPPGANPKTWRTEQTKAASKSAANVDRVRSTLTTLESQWDLVSNTIDRAIANVGSGWWTAGMSGAALSKVPGTPAYTIARDLETIRANIGFDRLQSMRDNSPTGGALGNVSNFESALLQATQGSLDQYQNPQALIKNLRQIKENIERLRTERRAAFTQTYPNIELPERQTTGGDWQEIDGVRIRKKQ